MNWKPSRTGLAAAGFHRYEISNYHRPGYACRHNLLYWTGGHYLGLVPVPNRTSETSVGETSRI